MMLRIDMVNMSNGAVLKTFTWELDDEKEAGYFKDVRLDECTSSALVQFGDCPVPLAVMARRIL